MSITPVLYGVYFKFSVRKHPQTGELSGYYRLVESYRNADNKVCHRTILNVGFMDEVTPEQLNKIQKKLTERYEHKQVLFDQEQDDPLVKKYVEEFWQRIVASKKIDIVSAEKLSRMVNVDTLQHSNAREIGPENIAYQTWEKLQLTPLLLSHGFTQEQARLAATQVVSRAVYPASELETTRWIKENSAVCELTEYDIEKTTKDKLYESALHLYQGKGGVKKLDKVHQRIGRAKEKYPSVQHYYIIDVSHDAKINLATEITWRKDEAKHQEKNESLGIYFLRTNLNVANTLTA